MSNVPTWRRKLSKIEYLHKTYMLEKYIVQMVYNTPSKYRRGFGETLIGLCDKAIFHGRIANDIRITNEATFDYREYELSQMKAAVDNIATHVYIWGEAMRHHDGISDKQNEWLYDKEEDVGLYCDEIIALIGGIKRYDRSQYDKIKGNDGA